MKIKHIKLNNKVFMGLFSLLFILSALNTSAILSMTEPAVTQNQGAQVSATASKDNCLEVTHKYNRDYMFNNVSSNYFVFGTDMNFDVKNRCAFGVGIIKPSVYASNNGNLANVKLQTVNVLGDIYDLDSSLFQGHGLSNAWEIATCIGCNSGEIINYQSVGGMAQVFLIAAGQTKRISWSSGLVSAIDVPHLFDFVLDNIKYVRQTALTDGVISQNEIMTKQFTQAEKKNHMGDFLQHLPSLGGMIGGDISKLGLPNEVLDILNKVKAGADIKANAEAVKTQNEKSPAVLPSSSGVRR